MENQCSSLIIAIIMLFNTIYNLIGGIKQTFLKVIKLVDENGKQDLLEFQKSCALFITL